MKLLLENWRQYLNEQNESMFGAFVKYEPGYTIELSLVDLSVIKTQLSDVNSMEEFIEKLNDRTLYDKAIVGYISAGSALKAGMKFDEVIITVNVPLGDGFKLVTKGKLNELNQLMNGKINTSQFVRKIEYL